MPVRYTKKKARSDPLSTLVNGRVVGLVEVGQVLGAGDELGPHARHVRVGDLAVDEFNAFGFEMFHKFDQGILTCVRDARKHGFPAETAPHDDAIKPAYQLAVLPYLNGVCVTCLVQFAVSGFHLGGNPRAGLTRPRDMAAVLDDGRKGFVPGAAEAGAPHNPLHAFRNA